MVVEGDGDLYLLVECVEDRREDGEANSRRGEYRSVLGDEKALMVEHLDALYLQSPQTPCCFDSGSWRCHNPPWSAYTAGRRVARTMPQTRLLL